MKRSSRSRGLRHRQVGFALAVWGPAAASATPTPNDAPAPAAPRLEPVAGEGAAAASVGDMSTPPSLSNPETPRPQAGLPLIALVYTSQVQLGGLALVNAPAVGLATEFPRWSGAITALAARWRGGFEHHATFQNRWYAGVGPVIEWSPLWSVALEFGLNASLVLLRSLWHPFHFDAATATWSSGEGQLKFTSELGAQGGVWWKPDLPLRVGAFYGLSVLYPVSPANGLPLLPLTKLGLAVGWSFR